jgi:hypothetical protein
MNSPGRFTPALSASHVGSSSRLSNRNPKDGIDPVEVRVFVENALGLGAP